MNANLDFSLPRHQSAAPGAGGGGRGLLAVLLVLVLTAQGLMLWRLRTPQLAATAGPATTARLTSKALEDLAMRLENQGLRPAAADTWLEYLASGAAAEADKAAKVWYRIGKLRQESDSFADALAAYYRSESLARLPELEPEINRRAQECLEKLGRFSALRYELADRVGLDGQATAAGAAVLAEIGSTKITRADLERIIEEAVDRQLAQYGGGRLPEADLRQQRQQILKMLDTETERQRLLERHVLEELLYREARASGLAEQAEVRRQFAGIERQFLAGKMFEQTMQNEIKITPSDLETYYEANKGKFVEPARASLSHILVATEAEAVALLEKLRGGADFAELAASVSLDKATAAKGGELPGFLRAGQTQILPGAGNLPEAATRIFQAAAGEVLDKPFKSDKGFHIFKVRGRDAERQKPFSEVRNEVHNALRSAKEREVQEAYFEKLRAKYNAVIHPSRLQDGGKQPDDAAGAAKTKKD